MIHLQITRGKHWLGAALLAFLAFSCEFPESERMPEVMEMTILDTNPTALTTSLLVQVKCDLHWTVELEDSSWGSVEVTQITEGSGGTCTVSLGVNKAEEARENALILKAGKGELRKTFSQQGLSTFFSPRKVQLTGTQEVSVSFAAPSAWTASTEEDWVELGTTSGEKGVALLKVKAGDANENVGAREGKVTVAIGGNSFDIPVTQGQTDVILSEDTDVSFDFEGGQFTVRTRYNVDFKIEVSDNWVTHESTKAPLHESVETFLVAENEDSQARTATVSFSGGEAGTLVVTVSQEGKDPILNVTQPGFYGIDGTSYVLGSGGWNQHSRRLSPDGGLRYRLLNGSTLCAVTLEGVNTSARQEQQFPLHLQIRCKKETLLIRDYNATVLYCKDGLLWLKESDATYFVVEL